MALSNAALALFRLHLERHGDLDAEANRAAYQELKRAAWSLLATASAMAAFHLPADQGGIRAQGGGTETGTETGTRDGNRDAAEY